jgi:glucose/arabinose dehydrogenase
VRFGTGGGDGAAAEPPHTLEGSSQVLDGAWHHLACVRDAQSGAKRIYVDGALDFESGPSASTDDLSYPDAGVPGGGPASNPELWLGGPKTSGAGAPPAFRGLADELRLWERAFDGEDVTSWYDRVAIPVQPGLVAMYRFEVGSGTTAGDHGFLGAPAGTLAGGTAWRKCFAAPADVAPISHGLFPPGFHRERVLEGLLQPTTLALLPDGAFLVAERAGTIHRFKDGVAAPVLTIPASLATIEYGIMGLCLDPSFATNRWFYVHYTSLAPHDRVARYTLPASGRVDPASEVVIWENAALGPGHTGGAISFGPDGKLYIPTGDAFFPPNSQDLTNQNGKVLRLNPDGTVPSDNPAIPGADPAIWAYGLRNPFRSVWDAPTGTFWIADVGGDDGTAYEELHQGLAGANYGWPLMQGPECVSTGCGGMTAPPYAYKHGDPDLSPGLISASITGGLFYRATRYPAQYQGSYFFGDYANGWMRRLRFDAGGGVLDAPLFVPIYTGGTVVDFAVDPSGELWYLTVGLPWSTGPDDPALYRVIYTPPEDPAPISTVVLDTSPSGLLLLLDGYPVTTPFTLRARVGEKRRVTAPLFAFEPATGATLGLLCWSDGLASEHAFTVGAGAMNLTAAYGASGAPCESGCGFSTYGHGVGGANVLGLVGGSGAAPGKVLVTKTTGLAPSAPVWVGTALHPWSFPILGGTVLIDSFSQFSTVALPSSGGESVWSVLLPSTPSLAGATFYLQAIALDPAQVYGLAFSNGLELTLCP